jgi:hypothetical protein
MLFYKTCVVFRKKFIVVVVRCLVCHNKGHNFVLFIVFICHILSQRHFQNYLNCSIKMLYLDFFSRWNQGCVTSFN